MRKLRRPKISLPTLVDIRIKYPFDAEGEAGFPEGKWNNPDVRGALYAMHGWVCAYCGSEASDSRGDVEHYRPKSIYPWLTYEYTNYLLGCRICNTKKSNVFPLRPRSTRLQYDPRVFQDSESLQSSLAREERMLLDPVNDPVDEWLDVDYESDFSPVRASVAVATDSAVTRYVDETIDFFGLNTVVKLVQKRNKQVTAAIYALRKWLEGDSEKGDAVRALSNRYTPHGWAVRRVSSQLAPSLTLQTAEEDLKGLVDENLQQLAIADNILARKLSPRVRERVQNQREEACWALAVLWKDPPAGSPALIVQWIDATGKRAAVEPFFNQLKLVT